MSFIVTKDGAVAEAMIEDSSVRGHRPRCAGGHSQVAYTPATRNGEPVDHPMTDIVIRMQLEGEEHGASKDFVRKYKEITALMAAGDLPRQSSCSSCFVNRGRRNLYEDAWYWSLRLHAADGKKQLQHRRAREVPEPRRGAGHRLPAARHVSSRRVTLFVLRVSSRTTISAAHSPPISD